MTALARIAGVDVASLSRIESMKQGPPRKTNLLKIVRAFGWPLSDPRAQALLQAGGYKSPRRAVLGSPLRVNPGKTPSQEIGSILRELRLALLRAVDLVAELETLVADDE